MNRSELTHAVKTEARRLGFSLVGVTTPDPPAHLDVFQDWLKQDRHAEMAYLTGAPAVQKRADPRLILPECRSILVLGTPYHRPTVQSSTFNPQPAAGRIAAYAWGDDYHEVLPPRLRLVVNFIAEQTGESIPNRCYTDTGPILERELAQRAGLGWIGKNTCLINPKGGSYFLLAEILLGVELEPDPPFSADRCGSCTRCIDACPTNCILPDRTLDARRCISYLTIELKGPIPADLRPKMGDWIFGCDDCQQVCPWNERFSTVQGDPAFAARPDALCPELLSELSLTREAFNRKFKASPLKRAKRRGYLRSVAVALGNAFATPNSLSAPSNNQSATIHQAVGALSAALHADPEPLLRQHAAWALGQIGGEAARQPLAQAVQSETDPHVLQEIEDALERLSFND